ncbi:MAG: hypothetical protein QOG43_1793 [Actinomycetota bacterium]|nr:hypothetical protein [Actinomycetota bacterium]
MTIRPIGDDEADTLGRITVDLYTAEFGVLPDDYVAELSDVRGRAQEALVLVAVDELAAVVGGITYVDRPGPLASIDRPDQAELRMLAVAPEVHGQGIGTRLVQACIEQARADGKGEVTLHTASSMLAAQRLYQRAGFRRRPDRDLVVDGGEDGGGIQLLAYALEL